MMRRRTEPYLTLPDKSGVLYVRLYQRMRALILEGRWPAGMRLPSSRTLAADLGISRNTASLALEHLLADGWIEARSRAGVFVSHDLSIATPPRPESGARPSQPGRPPVPFELSQGAIDAFPFERWSKIQSRVWARAVPDALYESDPAGDAGLRQSIARVIAPARGLTCDADEIIIVTSAQAALDLVAAALGRGKTVVVEDPGWIHAHATFAARGMAVVPVRTDCDGLHVDAARRAAPGPALIHTTPAIQFPTGGKLSDPRRAQLLDWAREADAWVIEDDYDSDACFDGGLPRPPLRQEDGSDRVIHLASFNRLLFPSLRLGFMVVPRALHEPLLRARSAIDGFVNLPNQLVLRDFIEEGGFSAHRRRCRDLHRQRRDALIEALKPYAGRLFEADFAPVGLHLIARPIGLAADEVAGALRRAGIACTTIAELSALADPAEGVLLGFAAFSPDVIEAMRPALAAALDPLLAG